MTNISNVLLKHGSFLLIISAVIGCGGTEGPPRFALDGTVTLDGKPLENGVINFIPNAHTKAPTTGATIANGRFAIGEEAGVAEGRYRVEIESFVETTEKTAGADELFENESQNIIPKKYNIDSVLTLEVAADGPTKPASFDLESPKVIE